MTGPELLTVAQCADLIGVAPGSWRVMVSRGLAPAADDPGDPEVHPKRRNPRWSRASVEAWQAARPGRGGRAAR